MAIGQVKSIWPILSSSSIPTRCCCAPLLLCADGFGSTLYSRGMAIGQVQSIWPILSSSSIPTRYCCAPLLLCADGFGSTLYSRGMAIGQVKSIWPILSLPPALLHAAVVRPCCCVQMALAARSTAEAWPLAECKTVGPHALRLRWMRF